MREAQNLTHVAWAELCKAATVCLLTAYQSAKRLFICLIRMREAVWGCCHPQLWHYAIIFTPQAQVTQYPKTVLGCSCMPIDSISICSNTLYMSNVDVGSSLRRLSASIGGLVQNLSYFQKALIPISSILTCSTSSPCNILKVSGQIIGHNPPVGQDKHDSWVACGISSWI